MAYSGRNCLKRKKDGSLVSGSLLILACGDSYSYGQLILKYMPGGYVFFNKYNFSRTTSKHQSIILSEVPEKSNIVSIEVPEMGPIMKLTLGEVAQAIAEKQDTPPSESLKKFLSLVPGCMERLEFRVETIKDSEKLYSKINRLRENLRKVNYKTPEIFRKKINELLEFNISKEDIYLSDFLNLSDEKLSLFAECFLSLESENIPGLTFSLGEKLKDRCLNVKLVKAFSNLGD